jgi:hypothetical protein
MVDTDSVLDEIEERQPWDQRPDESPRDYARFIVYRDQPPTKRSKNQVFIETTKDGDQDAHLAGGPWYEMTRRFEWDSRVAAWDKHQIEQRLAEEQQERLDARRLRRAKMQESIDTLDALIADAKAAGNSSEARLLLGERRLYLAELRREHGDDITKVERVDPNQTIDVVIPGLNDDDES